MKQILALILIVSLCSGCSLVRIKSPEASAFAFSVGNKRSFKSLTYGQLKVEGYENDQASALGTVTEAAVKAAVASVKP